MCPAHAALLALACVRSHFVPLKSFKVGNAALTFEEPRFESNCQAIVF